MLHEHTPCGAFGARWRLTAGTVFEQGPRRAGGCSIGTPRLKDKFGVSWQVVPTVLPEMLQDQDPKKAKRVMAAMLKMKRIDIGGLKKAYEGH